MQKRLYETTVVFNGALEDAAIEEAVTRVKDFIMQNGGEILEEDRIGKKRLIFPIEKRANGYYFGARFNATPDMIGRLEKNYVLEEQILRFLTITLDEKLLRTRELNRKRAEQRQQEADAKRALEELAVEELPKVIPVPVEMHEQKHGADKTDVKERAINNSEKPE